MRELDLTGAAESKLQAFAQAFHGLYAEKGPDDPFDPASVRGVIELAIEGLGPAAGIFTATDVSGEAEYDGEIVFPVSVSCVVRSAASIVFGHSDPFRIGPKEIDDAYATLAGAAIGRCPSP